MALLSPQNISNNWRGMIIDLLISADAMNVDISALAAAAIGRPLAGPTRVNVIVNGGVNIGSNDIALPSFKTGSLPAGSFIDLINDGLIAGPGGAGGYGIATRSPHLPGGDGEDGGTGIEATELLFVTNNGIIAGGGGGGAGSNNETPGPETYGDFGGSGGGGAGLVPGISGTPAGTHWYHQFDTWQTKASNAGTAGTTYTGGVGGRNDNGDGAGLGGYAGDGGDLGQPGTAADGSWGGTPGQGGPAIVGSANILLAGDIRGSII